jgi:hypothetical protein
VDMIKVICKGPWIVGQKRYERGDVVEIEKDFHDELVKKWGEGCFDYPKPKKAEG